MSTPHQFANAGRAVIAVVLSLVCGCGDETTRLAGTIDLPKKVHSQPTVKNIAKARSNTKTSSH
jgi:hypothetical protein